MKIALFDYGAGNLHSLGKALEAAGGTVHVTGAWEEALSADALVLPGVGAFGPAARSLPDDRSDLLAALESGLPCLGICLGMQLLFSESEEAMGEGIGLVPGSVRLLEADIVPQMGWNDVELTADQLFEGLDELVAYYANSYVCVPDDSGHVVATTVYDGISFAAAVRRGNCWGVQFHPEKSSGPGRRIISNFVELARAARSDR